MTLLKQLYIFLFVRDLLDPSDNAVPLTSNPRKRSLMADVAWLTLVSYIFLLLKPVMPIIADKMAHTFWENYHVLTVHSINGKFHVHLELKMAAKHTDKDKSASSSKSFSEEYPHIISNTTSPLFDDVFISRSYASYQFSIPISHPEIDYQPPKV